jgi:predicted double-glycine peptidase
MNPWLETSVAGFLSIIGILLAVALAKCPRIVWTITYFLCLAVIIIFGVERYVVGLDFIPPFSWVVTGHTRYILAAFAVPILIVTPATKLPRRRDQLFLRIFTIIFLIGFVIFPFFLTALARNKLTALQTKIDPNGICLQQTAYTCGPAAAVTALRKLGISADEGQLAIWSETSQFGTTPDELAAVIRTHYASDGVEVRYQRFRQVSDLAQPSATLAVVKYDFLTDRFVAVLSLTDKTVTVGDPLTGKMVYSYDDFAKLWRFSGIALDRIPFPPVTE